MVINSFSLFLSWRVCFFNFDTITLLSMRVMVWQLLLFRLVNTSFKASWLFLKFCLIISCYSQWSASICDLVCPSCCLQRTVFVYALNVSAEMGRGEVYFWSCLFGILKLLVTRLASLSLILRTVLL